MKAIAYLLSNANELIQSEKLALPNQTQPLLIEKIVYFPVRAISFAFLLEDGRIKTIQAGQEIILKFDKKVWNRITAYLEHE